MASLRGSISRSFLSASRSVAVFRTQPPSPRAAFRTSSIPSSGSSQSQSRRGFSYAQPRSAAALGATMSLLPLHSVVAVARLNSQLAVNSRVVCGLFKGWNGKDG
ncbi:unknownprotein [Zostera marina]|uniref:Uncharacterized protein n=1 Tax=Zostera marina TaxID=29655 RepID=A0A0K9P686_ZOSMR|nr:unknownprotein [Zostera marina]